MQKFFDQAISGNWSYNPEHFEDNGSANKCDGTRSFNYI